MGVVGDVDDGDVVGADEIFSFSECIELVVEIRVETLNLALCQVCSQVHPRDSSNGDSIENCWT